MIYSRLPDGLRVEPLTITIADLPTDLNGTVLVQLSDFHAGGWGLSKRLLAATITAVNHLRPDLIVLTGDYVINDPAPIMGLAQQLQQLRSRLGTYAILGNHDLRRPESRTIITQAFQQAQICVLWDEIAYPLGKGLPLVGLRDYWSPRFKPAPIMNQLPPNLPRIVLSHNPDSAQTLKNWRVDLQLSGHTHGGQIVMPGYGPVLKGIKALRQALPHPWRCLLDHTGVQTLQHWEWAAGLHRVGQNLLYVNRGLGAYFPGRYFCPPEITVLTLVRRGVEDH